MNKGGAEWLEINWRLEMKKMQPYLLDRGGIICIHGSESAACNTFIKLIRRKIAESEGACTIQINPSDEETRSSIGIIHRLETKLGITSEMSIPNIQIGNYISAGSGVEISDITVELRDDPFQELKKKQLRCESLIEEIKRKSQNQKIAVVLYKWDQMYEKTVEWFWNDLWYEGLHDCIENGLLLICLYEGNIPGIHYLNGEAPEPDLDLQLPPLYIAESRIFAREDLSRLFSQITNETYESSLARADGVLISNHYQPTALHTNLPLHRLELSSR